MTSLFHGDDAYHNGAFMLAEQFSVYSNFFRPREAGLEFPSSKIGQFFDYGTSDGYQFFLAHGPSLQALATAAHNPLLDQNIEHDTFDRYWQDRDIAKHLHNIHCAVLNVGGWFDAEDLAGTFRTYHAIAKENAEPTNMLVVGPRDMETGCALRAANWGRWISAQTQGPGSAIRCSFHFSNIS